MWTTNGRLHAYYRRLGFRFRDLADDPDYPSRAFFERSTDSGARTTRRCSGPWRRWRIALLLIAIQVAIELGRPGNSGHDPV